MHAMTSAAAVVPYRWLGHGIDVRVSIRRDRDPMFFAVDVLRALEVLDEHELDALEADPYATTDMPGEVLHQAGVELADGTPVKLYAIDEVLTVAEDHPNHLTADFCSWYHDVVDSIIGGDVLADATPEEPGAVELAAGGTYTVGAAARILSGDPALSYGRNTLFAAMRRTLGWIDRDAGIWVPSTDALRDGHLVRHNIRLETSRLSKPGERISYPQIRVTTAGLKELHRRLGGVGTITLDAPPTPTLVEDL